MVFNSIILFLISLLGFRPQESKGTVLRLKVGEKDPGHLDQWAATKTSHEGNAVNISVRASCEAIIGGYCSIVFSLNILLCYTINDSLDRFNRRCGLFFIGRYSVFVETVSTDGEGESFQTRKEFDEDTFIVLFNPWCKGSDTIDYYLHY